MNKKKISEEVMRMLDPLIKKELYRISPQNREDIKQEIYYKIIKKVKEEDIENLPNLREILQNESKDTTRLP